jgi:hypothetical protein
VESRQSPVRALKLLLATCRHQIFPRVAGSKDGICSMSAVRRLAFPDLGRYAVRPNENFPLIDAMTVLRFARAE